MPQMHRPLLLSSFTAELFAFVRLAAFQLLHAMELQNRTTHDVSVIHAEHNRVIIVAQPQTKRIEGLGAFMKFQSFQRVHLAI